MSKGRLTIVGTGIITPQHMTLESVRHIEAADIVYYIVPDPLAFDFLSSLNGNLVSLADCYQKTNNRVETYDLMVSRVMQSVEQGLKVTAVFYGHPSVFVTPSHKLIELAKCKQISAIMLPGISAEDCLFSDLGVDPSKHGCLSLEATYFLLNKVTIDPYSSLIVWQLGVVGDLEFSNIIAPSNDGLTNLKDKLSDFYPLDHQVIIYEAPTLPGFNARMDRVSLESLDKTKINDISTLYVPPLEGRLKDTKYYSKPK